MRHQNKARAIQGYLRVSMATWFFGMAFGFFAFVFMIDYITGLDRYNNKAITQLEIFIFSLARLPFYAKEMVPFAFYLATMVVISQKMRSLELIVARSLGISVWSILKPFLALAFVTGLAVAFIFDPLSKITFGAVNTYLSQTYQVRSLTDTVGSGASKGWYSQATDDGGFVVVWHRGGKGDAGVYEDVVMDSYNDRSQFQAKFIAASMDIREEGVIFSKVHVAYPDKKTEFYPDLRLDIDVDFSTILSQFSPADELSLYELPSYIQAVSNMGYRTDGYWTQVHKILATPLLYMCMVLLAACFSLRLPRKGGAVVIMALGLILGFVLYFATNLVVALGATGALRPAAAIWLPLFLLALFPLYWLLANEDG